MEPTQLPLSLNCCVCVYVPLMLLLFSGNFFFFFFFLFLASLVSLALQVMIIIVDGISFVKYIRPALGGKKISITSVYALRTPKMMWYKAGISNEIRD